MSEPLINPWYFYFIDIIDNLKDFFIVLAVISWIIVVIGSAVYFFADANTPSEKEIFERVDGVKYKILFIAVFISLCQMLVPTKETLYKMLITSQITPHNIQLFQTGINGLLDNIEKRITNVVKQNK